MEKQAAEEKILELLQLGNLEAGEPMKPQPRRDSRALWKKSRALEVLLLFLL